LRFTAIVEKNGGATREKPFGWGNVGFIETAFSGGGRGRGTPELENAFS
jgi:hypothetical protein